MPLFVGHDVGTSGTKSVLLDDAGRVRAEAMAPHRLSFPRPGFAEQDPEEWLRAAGETTRALLTSAGASAADVGAIAFAGQMLTLVPLDAAGRATRPAIAWMDDRAEREARRIVRRMGGASIVRLLAGAVPTGKDLVAKVAWLRANERDAFARTRALGDATSWLVARTSGHVGIDPTAASATGLLDLRTRALSRTLAWLADFPLDRMPKIAPSTSIVGALHREGAEALGLRVGTKVAAGLADIPAMALGTGATRVGDAHLYLGTSAWIARATREPAPVPRAGIAAIPSGAPSGCLAVGETEAAGASRAWAARTLGITLESELDALASASPAGARGLLFLPWLFGERAPIPDATLRGGFANLSLEHERADVARSVLEGVAMNLRGILDALAPSDASALRVGGGGAQSDLWLQIVADVTGRRLLRLARPRFAGARGAAFVAAVATRAVGSVDELATLAEIDREFAPDAAHGAIYDAGVDALRTMQRPLAHAGALLRGRA